MNLFFYGEGLLAPRPIPKLEDHPLSFVRGYLFNIFAANLQLEAVPSIRNPRTWHAVVTKNFECISHHVASTYCIRLLQYKATGNNMIMLQFTLLKSDFERV
jgi:hypothetical protein